MPSLSKDRLLLYDMRMYLSYKGKQIKDTQTSKTERQVLFYLISVVDPKATDPAVSLFGAWILINSLKDGF